MSIGSPIFRRRSVLLFLMITGVFLLTRCIPGGSKEKVKESRVAYSDFAGSAACKSCHADIHDAHINTAHFKTSAEASPQSILGSFKEGANSFSFNPLILVKMEERKDGFYQVEYANGVEKRARRFDISVGSGTRGQTYLYWWKDTLAQLPISYFTSVHEWTNSPGYSNRVMFGRPVTARCMECHSTFATVTTGMEAKIDLFDKKEIIYGVDCEKCHGPSLKHVEYHQGHPGDTAGKFTLNPARFSRQQQLDLCAVCHGGKLKQTSPSFSFLAGDKLGDHFSLDTIHKTVADIDVHGNQYGMMAASQCFIKSQMTCGSCHAPHDKEKGNTAVYAQRCQSCHNTLHVNECKLKATKGSVILNNCSSCHMPELPSGSIMVIRQGEQVPTKAGMHTHFISIYPELTDKVLGIK